MVKPTSATQDFLPIKDIKNGVVILENGQMNMVLLVSSINFALKSVDTQTAILRQFQSLLDTLDFSIQFYMQSRRLDIEPYLALLAAQEPKQNNDLMKIQLREYMEFVRTFTTEVDIMAKNFFVIIPYTPSQLNIKKNLGNLFGKKSQDTLSESTFEEHRTQLEQRVSVIEQGLNRIGVRSVALNKDELIELYYHILNPQDIHGNAPTQ